MISWTKVACFFLAVIAIIAQRISVAYETGDQTVNWTAVTCLFLLPIVAGIQRFSVAYGYEGVSREEAHHSARGAVIGTAALGAIAVAVHPAFILN
jgi:hypothetical protein